ncbi:hypothetical protein [Algoriphagus chordae]|uniref:Uncharacterized protein n=1 Tax=Algoriphagus chordae TaxID=237019 RepID=A0A2W7T0Q9_9BACT|nr:hypothetical protein [Algoriphagus chordae]PZX56732.1 hypothetical protein LV85_00665 [Algoriphagus chordae]
MRHLLVLFLSVSLFFSCNDSNDCEGFEVGKEFEIAIEQQLENCLKNISVKVIEIQDSRCPAGAQCIWAGMIVLRGELIVGGQKQYILLSTNENASGFPDEFSTLEYTVKLVDAIPYLDLNKPYKPEDQRAILIISKRST